jgi:hypothetical protein
MFKELRTLAHRKSEGERSLSIDGAPEARPSRRFDGRGEVMSKGCSKEISRRGRERMYPLPHQNVDAKGRNPCQGGGVNPEKRERATSRPTYRYF